MITNIGHIIGYLLIILGISELVPILAALTFGENHLVLPFFICSMLTIFVGTGFYLAFSYKHEKPSRFDIISFLIFVWTIIPVFASIPFMVTGVLTKFTNAYFEAVSAFTTSGSTMLANTALAPKAILFWRSFLQWQGGIFIFVLAISIIPLSSIGGSELFKSTLVHREQEGFLERLKSTLKNLALLYVGLTLVCVILLAISGMTTFDSLTTAMATLSSGGFTNHANSGVNSLNFRSEIILIPFMIIAATNLTYHWSFLTSGRLRLYKDDYELRYFLIIILIASLVIFLTLANSESGPDSSIISKLGLAIFTSVSALSTTGFLPDGAGTMPISTVVVCIILLFIGGSMGSSAGGFKIMRLKVLLRHADVEISRLAHPHGVVPMRVNNMTVTDTILMSVWTLFFLYLSSIAFFSLLYGILGYEVGVAIGLTVVNLFSAGSMTELIAQDFIGYSSMSYPAKWLSSAIMIIGRLEIMPLLIFLSPGFRKS
ncbi:MAG: potassium transporter TrkG [Emcibacteraceae bacterium]